MPRVSKSLAGRECSRPQGGPEPGPLGPPGIPPTILFLIFWVSVPSQSASPRLLFQGLILPVSPLKTQTFLSNSSYQLTN